MPIYEFQCKNCDEKFELLCRMGQTAAEISCNLCGSRRVSRAISSFYSHSSGSSISGGGSSCSGCTSGNCSGCGCS